MTFSYQRKPVVNVAPVVSATTVIDTAAVGGTMIRPSTGAVTCPPGTVMVTAWPASPHGNQPLSSTVAPASNNVLEAGCVARSPDRLFRTVMSFVGAVMPMGCTQSQMPYEEFATPTRLCAKAASMIRQTPSEAG